MAANSAVYMSSTSQNFRLFHEPNLSVLNFRIVLLMYPRSLADFSGAVFPPGYTCVDTARWRLSAAVEAYR